jgi:DNA-binding transcriptional LysR family regulator
VTRAARGHGETVRIGSVGSALVAVAPELARSLRQQCPELAVELIEAVGAEQVDRLRRGLIDLGIIHVPSGQPPLGLDALPLADKPLQVVLPANHRLGSRTAVRLSELVDDRLVVMRREDEADTQHVYLDACRDAGLRSPPLVEVASLQGFLGQVSASAGWGFVVDSVATAWRRPDVRFLTIRGTSPRLPTALVWSPEHLSSAATAVLATAECQVNPQVVAKAHE